MQREAELGRMLPSTQQGREPPEARAEAGGPPLEAAEGA